MSTATTPAGRGARAERLRELLGERDLGGVVLRRPVNFAWYTGGADSRVDHVAPDGVADVLVTGDEELVIGSTMPGARCSRSRPSAGDCSPTTPRSWSWRSPARSCGGAVRRARRFCGGCVSGR